MMFYLQGARYRRRQRAQTTALVAVPVASGLLARGLGLGVSWSVALTALLGLLALTQSAKPRRRRTTQYSYRP